MADGHTSEHEPKWERMIGEQERTLLVEDAQKYLQSIIDTGRVPFLVLGPTLRIKSANRAFYQTFGVFPAETEDRFVYQLGDGQWDIPELRVLLDTILTRNSHFDDFQVEHDFPMIGRRFMLLNARKIYRLGNNSQLILLSIEDVTERREAERKEAEAQELLQDAYDQLQIAHAKLQEDYEREHHIAQTLQRPLMLETPENAFPNLSIATLYSAAWKESEVGGDFFDAIPLADGRLALIVGDASGKGLAAAARATEVKDVLRAFLRVYPYYPALTLTRLNDYLCDLQRLDQRTQELFTALSLVVINVEKSEFVCAQAGIDPLILVRADGGIERVSVSNLPLGINPKEVYVDKTARFHPGDLLILTTDGLSEARRGKEFLTTERIDAIIQESLSEPTVRKIGAQILAKAREFSEGQLQDDACLVVARRD